MTSALSGVRIVHIYKDYYPPTVGGIEQNMERLATHQAAAGAEVTALVSAHGGRRTFEERVNGVRVIRVAEWARALSAPFCPSMPKHLARLRADLYHLHYPNPTGEVSWLAVRPEGAMVMTWHGDIIRQKLVMPIYGRFVEALLGSTDAVMTTFAGQAEKSPLLRHYMNKVTVVPLGIDLEPFTPKPEHAAEAATLRAQYGDRIVLYVGRLVAYKGAAPLVEAARWIDGRVLIVGAGPERERLDALHAQHGLGDRVVFLGRVEPHRIVNMLAAADVGVLPAIGPQETFGLSMVEMMAYGLPVVCTEVGTGTSYVNQHGETGLVVPPNDPPALAAAINKLFAEPETRRRMGAAARARAQTYFSTEAMMRGVEQVYMSALARHR